MKQRRTASLGNVALDLGLGRLMHPEQTFALLRRDEELVRVELLHVRRRVTVPLRFFALTI